MVWVDEVLSLRPTENGIAGECLVRLHADALYRMPDGSIRPSAIIEWIAQSYGYVKACQFKTGAFGEAKMKRAYLVGVTQCEAHVALLATETELVVFVEEVRELPPASIVQGKVASRDGTRAYGSALIKLFADVGDTIEKAKSPQE